MLLPCPPTTSRTNLTIIQLRNSLAHPLFERIPVNQTAVRWFHRRNYLTYRNPSVTHNTVGPGSVLPNRHSFHRMKGLIQLSYRKVIDATAQQTWDRLVFDDTWQEFYMQAQSFEPTSQYQYFWELLANVPNADRLHYLTSRAAMGYLQQLNDRIPDITNAQQQASLPFTQFKFEILAAQLAQKETFRIAISFYSDVLTWIDTIGDRLLIAYGDQQAAIRQGQAITTDLIPLQPELSIWSYQPVLATNA